MTKRNIFAILFIFAAAVMSLESCKKGDNDPSISFKSRTARLKGKWVLSGKQAIISTSSTSNSASLTSITVDGVYNGTEESILINDAGVATTIIRRYVFDINFDENGTYVFNLNVLVPDPAISGGFKTLLYVSSGVWAWLDQGKDKYGLSLSNDFEPSIPDSLDPMTLLPYSISGAYAVDRLASDELILKRSGSYTTSEDTVVTNINFDGSFTFKR